MRVTVSAALLAQIETQARASCPREACGLLIGTRTKDAAHVAALAPSPNLAREADAFEIDPALLLRLQRELRGGPRALIGVYHSHPGGAPAPSARDVAGAAYPGFVWLICALADGGARHAAFWHDDGAPVPPRGLSPAALTIA